MTEVIWQGILVFNLIVLLYFVLLNTTYLGLSIVSFFALRRYGARMRTVELREIISGAGAPPVALIAPAFNEASNVVESVRSLLTLEYDDYEIIVVNDGSTDETFERLRAAFNLAPAPRQATAELPTRAVRGVYRSRRHPNLWVVDKENGGKSDALNAGLNHCQTPLFCAMDADTLLEREALVRIVRPFLEDARTVAAGGILRVVNGCVVRHGEIAEVGLPRRILPRYQVLEYLRAFLAGRMGWDAIGASLVISGAFGVFRRSIVVAAGGYATDTVGEDMELVVRLNRYCRESKIPYRITFVPDPVAWTEVPEDLGSLGRQRDRWQRGLMESLIRHRVMLFNPRYGRVGMVAYPHFFLLEMFGPVIEILGYAAFFLTVLTGRASPEYVGAFFAVAVAFGVVLSLVSVAMEELTFRRYPRWSHILQLFILAIAENVGYRQMTAWWRFRGTVSALRRRKGWGASDRTGFTTEPSSPTLR
jgi:cellulose synthase/poly-beta-1,6-N-acetylglucosamine synthase-like glycosyltransferase